MCGRFLNKLPAAEIARIFGTPNALPNYPARFNIAPTDPVLVVRFNRWAATIHIRGLVGELAGQSSGERRGVDQDIRHHHRAAE